MRGFAAVGAPRGFRVTYKGREELRDQPHTVRGRKTVEGPGPRTPAPSGPPGLPPLRDCATPGTSGSMAPCPY
ncbi:hypothetical protein GCM10010326_44750 [Streptomyces xanthochromogenes]|uniref:Uncharacterized protein n=1 Tax=Streptomyces xanthochromogenes TaxID=67384 RepID=A0ABQ3AEC5_9ACTN|nr:hypothetical protein GCM10010326_44750 [Streptomyces xanthochromogenes]